jgi:hypothetical protein
MVIPRRGGWRGCRSAVVGLLDTFRATLDDASAGLLRTAAGQVTASLDSYYPAAGTVVDRAPDLTGGQKAALSVSAVVQFGLAAAVWADLARRAPAQARGPKWRWAMVIAVNYAGPIAYFRWGRVRALGPHRPGP